MQMLETGAGLKRAGVEVVVGGLRCDYSGYDLVHLFNTTRINETFVHCRAARAAGIPVVVSTIWHSVREMRRFYAWRFGVPWFPIRTYAALREVYYARRSGFPICVRSVCRYRECQRDVVRDAAAILPNSEAELRQLREELDVLPRRAFIVPNGFAVEKAAALLKKESPRRGVVCAGRIEPRKNQQRVVEGFKLLGERGLMLRFFGAINESHGWYARGFQASLVPGWIEYGGSLKPEALYGTFRAAQVVVLASYFETTGLVALEGLACGARVVVSDSPYTRDYFRDAAVYCDPYSEKSIAEAIATALRAPPKAPPAWLNEYTWERAAELTLEAYRAVLGGRA